MGRSDMHVTKLRKMRNKRQNRARLNIFLWILVGLFAFFIVTIMIPGVLVKRIDKPSSIHNQVSVPSNPAGVNDPVVKQDATAVLKQEIRFLFTHQSKPK